MVASGAVRSGKLGRLNRAQKLHQARSRRGRTRSTTAVLAAGMSPSWPCIQRTSGPRLCTWTFDATMMS